MKQTQSKNYDVRLINHQVNKNATLQNNGSRVIQTPQQNNQSKSVEQQQRIRIISQQHAQNENPFIYQRQYVPITTNQIYQKGEQSTMSNEHSFLADEGQRLQVNDPIPRTASGQASRRSESCPLCPLLIQSYELKLNNISYHSYCIQRMIDEQIQKQQYIIKDDKGFSIQDEFIKQNFSEFYDLITQYRTRQNLNIKVNYLNKAMIENQIKQYQVNDIYQMSNSRMVEQTNRQNICTICNNKSNINNDNMKQLPCKHLVHTTCITQSSNLVLKKQLQCSQCKITLKPAVLRIFQIPIPEQYFQEQIKQIQKRYPVDKCQTVSCNEFWVRGKYDEKFCFSCQILYGSRIQLTSKPRSTSEQPTKQNQAAIRQDSIYKTQNIGLSDSRTLMTSKGICQFCREQAGFQYISLGCQHNYHQKCLKNLIEQQVKDQSTIFLTCVCKTKINYNTLRLVIKNDVVINQLTDNQLKNIQKKYVSKFQKCPNHTCSFFFVKTERGNSFYCPLCVETYHY